MKKLAIYVVYADMPVIDEYVLYMAKCVKSENFEIAIIVNGSLDKDSTDKLSAIAEHLFFRENIGYDCGAYKVALEEFLGWDYIRTFDEIVMLNDSFYGPLYPLADMFGEMSKKNLDFWGVTEQTPFLRYNYDDQLLPYHVQSYFLVVNTRLLHSTEFAEFWSNYIPSDDYFETVRNFELKFTEHFNSLGYKSGAYIDCSAFCNSVHDNKAYIFTDSFYLVSEHKCPLIKRKAFVSPHEQVLLSNSGETAYKTLEYIKKNTDYDENMIIKNLIRKSSPDELYIALHNNFCLSENKSEYNGSCKALIAAFIDRTKPYDDLINLLREIIADDIIIFSDEEKPETSISQLKNISYIQCIDVSEAMKRINSILNNYEYVCFLNNECTDNTVSEMYFKNLISGDRYISNIKNVFDENSFIGLISAPKPYWGSNFSGNDLKIPYGNMFWCRSSLVNSIVCGTDDIPSVLKKCGYMYATAMTESYASVYASNYHYMLDAIIRNVLQPRKIYNFEDIKRINSNIHDYCRHHNKIYIYGAGDFGHYCLNFLNSRDIDITGFVISDNQVKKPIKDTDVIYHLSEIEITEEVGIIVAVDKNKQGQIFSELKKRNIRHALNLFE